MSFWIIAIALSILALAPIVLILGRRYNAQSASVSGKDIQIYKDQLLEVDRDLARGVLSQADAKRTKLEVSRRLLDADAMDDIHASKPNALPLWVSVVIGTVMLLSGSVLYAKLGAPSYVDLPLKHRLELSQELRETRISQGEAEALQQGLPPRLTPDPEYVAIVRQLQEALNTRPDDIQGHILLARNAYAIGEYTVAYTAQERVIALKKANATAQDYADLADNLVLSAHGFVSPKAEQALTKSLTLNAQNGTANYYIGVMFNQIHRYDLAFSVWSKLLARSTVDDPWAAPIIAQMDDVAALAGVRYTVPELAQTTLFNSTLNGPDALDIDAASDMSAEDRAAFIQSMVDQLSTRLANTGGSPAEWAQLINALGVLGDTDRASAIWTEAQVVFGADPQAIASIRSAAQSAGVAN